MITILTSVFNGDLYIKHYLEKVSLCNNYTRCEHIIFNIIKSNTKYTNNLLYNHSKKYRNVVLIPIIKDPGLYELWNIGIKFSKNEYLLTLNIDDMISKDFLNMTYNYLEKNKDIDLVCTPTIVSHKPNTYDFSENSEIFHKIKYINHNSVDVINGTKYELYPTNKHLLQKYSAIKDMNLYNKNTKCRYILFDKYDMISISNDTINSYNIPHCCPVWRKKLHDIYGYFDEKTYGPYADYEFWLRCMDDTTLFGLIPYSSVIYYLNPNSYNIINSDKIQLNKIFYKYFGNSNIKSIAMNFITLENKKEVFFDLGKQINYNFGDHRAGWVYVLHNISNNIISHKNSIYLDSFIESTFFWEENADNNIHNYPWIGILHNPPNIPNWFEYDNQSFYSLCKKNNFIESLKYCKKIYVLSKYLADWLKNNEVIIKYNIKIDYFYHPTENPNIKFNFEKFINNKEKKILQIGWWLRKMSMIYMIPNNIGYKKYILGCNRFRCRYIIDKEKKFINTPLDYSRYNVNILEFINNKKYDDLLSCNIVFIYLYDSSANNIVIECISRNTPILVNKISAIIEYLGEDYPFYYETIEEATHKLLNFELIKKTHEYLKNNKRINNQIDIKHFINNINKYINPF